MLNPDEKMLKCIREAVHALNEGHINIHTFAMVVQITVEPNLYSSTFTAIAAQAMSKPLPEGGITMRAADLPVTCSCCGVNWDAAHKTGCVFA